MQHCTEVQHIQNMPNESLLGTLSIHMQNSLMWDLCHNTHVFVQPITCGHVWWPSLHWPFVTLPDSLYLSKWAYFVGNWWTRDSNTPKLLGNTAKSREVIRHVDQKLGGFKSCGYYSDDAKNSITWKKNWTSLHYNCLVLGVSLNFLNQQIS